MFFNKFYKADFSPELPLSLSFYFLQAQNSTLLTQKRFVNYKYKVKYGKRVGGVGEDRNLRDHAKDLPLDDFLFDDDAPDQKGF